MARKWILAALGAGALILGLLAYHLLVLRSSAEHYRLLLESPSIEEKRLHYDAIHRFPHPWNPYREQADRWLREEGHEWEFLRKGGSR